MAFSINISVCADVAWDLTTGPAFNAATGSISYSVGTLSNSPISTGFVKVLGGDSINGGSWVFANNTNCRGGMVGTPRPSYVRLVRRGDLSNDSNTGSVRDGIRHAVFEQPLLDGAVRSLLRRCGSSSKIECVGLARYLWIGRVRDHDVPCAFTFRGVERY